MWSVYMRIVATTLVVLCLGLTDGCGTSPSGDKKLGDGPPVSKDEAISTVTKLTPLKRVQTVDLTPPGPRMWVVYGLDESGRPGAAWVWKAGKVEGYTFLDKGISGSDATSKAKSMGLTTLNISPVLVNPSNPAWYVFVQTPDGSQSFVLVDLATGEVITK